MLWWSYEYFKTLSFLFETFQISWARQLPMELSYQILTIAEATYIDDARFVITSAAVDNVSMNNVRQSISMMQHRQNILESLLHPTCWRLSLQTSDKRN